MAAARATGRKRTPKKKRMTTAEVASMTLDAGRDSICKFVARANAQERLRIAERKRQRVNLTLFSLAPILHNHSYWTRRA